MTPQARIRRIGWFAALATCTALYLMLHLKVHAVTSEVVRAERQIVALEDENMLLETEFPGGGGRLHTQRGVAQAAGRFALVHSLCQRAVVHAGLQGG